MTGIWETADTITKARMNEKTIFQGTGSAISGLTTYSGMLVYCTSTGSGFTKDFKYIRNTANTAWSVDTGETEGSVIMAHTTTIGDYTIPTAVTASSSKNTFEWKTNEGWATETGYLYITPASSRLDWDAGGPSGGTLTFDLGSGYVSETAWEIRGKCVTTAASGSSATPSKFFIGLSSTTGGFTDTQDAIGFYVRSAADADTYKYANVYADGSGIGNEDYFTTQSITTPTIWFKIQRTSATNFTVSLYSESTFTTLIESNSTTITSGISGLRYLKFTISNVDQNNLLGYVETVTLNPTAASAPTSVLQSYVKDDNTGTLWTSFGTVNPNLILDANADVNLCGIAVYWDSSATTETEIKIQYATAAAPTTWTDVRKITVSNLTGSSWNYIRFNTIPGRYLRIYGTTATPVVLSIYETKLYKRTDAQVLTQHGHLLISSTDTSLSLSGS